MNNTPPTAAPRSTIADVLKEIDVSNSDLARVQKSGEINQRRQSSRPASMS